MVIKRKVLTIVWLTNQVLLQLHYHEFGWPWNKNLKSSEKNKVIEIYQYYFVEFFDILMHTILRKISPWQNSAFLQIYFRVMWQLQNVLFVCQKGWRTVQFTYIKGGQVWKFRPLVFTLINHMGWRLREWIFFVYFEDWGWYSSFYIFYARWVCAKKWLRVLCMR